MKSMRHSQIPTPTQTEEEESDIFPAWKTVGIIGVVIACFAIIYPKMIHPVIRNVFNQQNDASFDDQRLPAPPARAMPPGRIPTGPGQANPSSTPYSHSPFFESQHQQVSGKSNWHWILPFYTIGVVVFLLYTLAKIFFKRPSSQPRPRFNFRYDPMRECFEVDSGNNFTENNPLTAETNQAVNKMQNRLKETEVSMRKIMKQLEKLSKSDEGKSAERLKKTTLDTLEALETQFEEPPLENHEESVNNSAGKDTVYIRDLEKALSDFKHFTETYIEEHGKTKNLKSEENKPEIPEESEKIDENFEETENVKSILEEEEEFDYESQEENEDILEDDIDND